MADKVYLKREWVKLVVDDETYFNIGESETDRDWCVDVDAEKAKSRVIVHVTKANGGTGNKELQSGELKRICLTGVKLDLEIYDYGSEVKYAFPWVLYGKEA